MTVSGDSTIAVVDHFIIGSGFSSASFGGGIYNDQATLILNDSQVSSNVSYHEGGGIFNMGTMTINNSTIRDNELCCGSSWAGGGAIFNGGMLTINTSTLYNNSIDGYFLGSAIMNYGTIVLNNSTISGNTANAIQSDVSSIMNKGSLTVNSSTIANNMGGIFQIGPSVILQNTILANNTVSGLGMDCTNRINSAGYNLIGSSCDIVATTGDQISTFAHPIAPKLGPLQNNGGTTLTRALLSGSPAINAGNPGAPGSGGNTCPAIDQRGVARSANSVCDIGAYEMDQPTVVSIKRLDTNPASASQVSFLVTFSKDVTGVDLTAPFSDFTITKTGLTGITSIASVSGSGYVYTVIVNAGQGNGTILLNVIDDDTIKDVSGNSLGGTGLGNGDLSGETYNILTIPTQLLPVENSLMTSQPTYKWSVIPSATNYQYQLMLETKVIYTNTINATACKPTYCMVKPVNKLKEGLYKWRVKAMVNGIWKNFSVYKKFNVGTPKPGLWTGETGFYLAPSGASIYNYTMFVTVYSCGIHERPLVFTTYVPVVENSYERRKTSFYYGGAFKSKTSANGFFGLVSYYYRGCGYISGGPFNTTHTWNVSNNQSVDLGIFTGPILKDMEKLFIFNLDPVQP